MRQDIPSLLQGLFYPSVVLVKQVDDFLGWVVIDVMFNVVDLGEFFLKDLLRKRSFQAFSTYTYSPNLVLFNYFEVGCCVLIAQP